jgi:type II secretory pathway component PulK
LPVPTSVNVNTAPDQVLAALFTNLPATALKPVLDTRVSQPFADTTQFIKRLPSGTPPPPASLYDVKTGYFLVTIDIRYGRLQRRTEALIGRTSGKATVLWHRLPPLQFETKPDEKT